MPDTVKIKQRIVQLGGCRAAMDKPESLHCPECGRDLPLVAMDWPCGLGLDGLPQFVSIWPVYTCDDCVGRDVVRETPRVDLLGRAGIFGRNQQCRFENFKAVSQIVAHAKRQAESWAKDPAGILWLAGGPGSGKTHLALSIIRRRMEGGDASVLFAEVPYLLDRLTEDYLADDSPMLKETRWATVGLLVLDDLGAEKPTEHKIERLTMVVNERVLHDLPTIVTSNARPQEMGERLPARLLSRLQENGLLIQTGQEDQRKRRK